MNFSTDNIEPEKTDLTSKTDDELIAGIRQRKPHCLDCLIQRYEKRVYSFLLRMGITAGRAPSDAEDLTQEVFIRAFKSLPRYQSRGMFGAWIFTIARNVFKTYLSKNSSASGAKASDQQMAESLAQPSAETNSDEIHCLLAFLPEKYRQIVLLKYISGLSCAEIAQIEGLSAETVRQRLHRARNMIKENQK